MTGNPKPGFKITTVLTLIFIAMLLGLVAGWQLARFGAIG